MTDAALANPHIACPMSACAECGRVGPLNEFHPYWVCQLVKTDVLTGEQITRQIRSAQLAKATASNPHPADQHCQRESDPKP